MALTKTYNRIIQGSRFHIDDYGAVGYGVTTISSNTVGSTPDFLYSITYYVI